MLNNGKKDSSILGSSAVQTETENQPNNSKYIFLLSVTTGHKKKAFSVHSIEDTTSAITVGFIVDLNMKHQMQVHSHVTFGIQGGVQKKRENSDPTTTKLNRI